MVGSCFGWLVGWLVGGWVGGWVGWLILSVSVGVCQPNTS